MRSSRTNVSFYNKPFPMYLVYSLLTLAVFVAVSPYFVYQAIRYKKYIGSLRQRLGFLPITFNIDGWPGGAAHQSARRRRHQHGSLRGGIR